MELNYIRYNKLSGRDTISIEGKKFRVVHEDDYQAMPTALHQRQTAELPYGVAKSAQPSRHAVLLAQFYVLLAILPFDNQSAATYGIVRTTLERAGTPIGPLDTLIASHALSLGLIVMTNNVREFRRLFACRGLGRWNVIGA